MVLCCACDFAVCDMSGDICPTASSEAGGVAFATVVVEAGFGGGGAGDDFLAVVEAEWWRVLVFLGGAAAGFSGGGVDSAVADVDAGGVAVAVVSVAG